MNSGTVTKCKVVSFTKPSKKKVAQLLGTLAYKSSERASKLPPGLVADWQPSEEERYAVKMMVAGGMRHEDIAKAIHPLGPVSINTLKRKFRHELRDGKAVLTHKVVRVALEMALSGRHPSMTQFWLKCNAGWKDGGVGQGQNAAKFSTHGGTDDVVKRLQTTAKYMAETLPKQKTGTGS